MTNPVKVKRPLSVLAVAVLHLIVGLWGLIAAAYLIVVFLTQGDLPDDLGKGPFIFDVAILLGYILVGSVLTISAIGLLRLREPARKSTIALVWIFVLCVYLFFAYQVVTRYRLGLDELVAATAYLGYGCFVSWAFTRKRVRAAFASSTSRIEPVAVPRIIMEDHNPYRP